MEPLRLELSESTSLQLQNAPQATKDEVELYHSQLIAQVRRFYAQQQRELEQYAQARIKSANIREPPLPSVATRKIKSIVKRRPSTADKRVSFSNSPPQIELFKDEPDSDDEESSDLSPRQNAAHDNNLANTNTNTSSHSSDHIPATNILGPSSPRPGQGGALRVATPAIDLRPSQQPSDEHYEDLFDFEDVIENSSISSDPDLSVQSHEASSSPVLCPTDKGHTTSAPATEPILSSSAAMDIVPSQKGIDGDGGPVPKTEAGRRDEAEEKMDLELSLKNLSLSKLGASASSMDPSQMSFSQRMEWENLWRLHGHRNIA